MLCHVCFECTVSWLKRKTYWNSWAYWQWVHWHHVFNGDVDEKLWWWSQACRPHSSRLQLPAFPSCYAWQWASCHTERELSRHYYHLIPLHSHIITTLELIEITLTVPDHVHFFCLHRPSPSKHKLTDCVHGRIPWLPQVLQPLL